LVGLVSSIFSKQIGDDEGTTPIAVNNENEKIIENQTDLETTINVLPASCLIINSSSVDAMTNSVDEVKAPDSPHIDIERGERILDSIRMLNDDDIPSNEAASYTSGNRILFNDPTSSINDNATGTRVTNYN